MITQKTYSYLSQIICYSAIFYLFLFLIFNFNYTYKYNVNFTQSFLTLFFSLLILSFLTYNSLENNEFNYLLFYFTYILAIPLLFHCLYLLFFREYFYENMSYTKIGITFILMLYLTLIWLNIRKLVNKGVIFTNNYTLLRDLFQILFTINFI